MVIYTFFIEIVVTDRDIKRDRLHYSSFVCQVIVIFLFCLSCLLVFQYFCVYNRVSVCLSFSVLPEDHNDVKLLVAKL